MNNSYSTIGPLLLTVPVKSKGKRSQSINEVLIDYSTNFHINHIKSIENNYSKSLYYNHYFDAIFNILNVQHKFLVDLTLEMISLFRKVLNINTEIIRSSDLSISGKKGEYLSKICFELSATEYIAAPGSKEYLGYNFICGSKQIPIKYFEYNHPKYPQLYGNFIPYMSIIDLIFNCGENSIIKIKEGIKKT